MKENFKSLEREAGREDDGSGRAASLQDADQDVERSAAENQGGEKRPITGWSKATILRLQVLSRSVCSHPDLLL